VRRQDVHARGDHARLRRHRLDDLRRGERDRGHAEVHRLEQRQAERRPADRVHVHAPAGQLAVHVALRDVVERADPTVAGDLAGLHAEQVDRRRLPEPLQ
jgi:hypothetical protein